MRKSLWCLILVFAFSFFVLPTTNVFASFRAGDEGPEVVELQARLIELGYGVSIADGVYGLETAQAVKQYQVNLGLEADGIVGQATFAALLHREMPPSRAGSSSTIRTIINSAFQYIGVPYVFGGTSGWGFDCSGFTQRVFAEAGIHLPRMADEQYYTGERVAYKNLQPGDLVFFETYEAGASHCGIYIGDGEFIHAGSSTGVTVSGMFDSYWGQRYLGATRVI
ncbi:MAG: NlpC/P60 family protein [Acidaminococcaceae bacterium]